MENLGIDSKLLIAQLVNFGIFFFVFHRFLAKPFMNYVKNERKNEEEKEVLMKKLQEGEALLNEREQEMRKEMKTEMTKVIEQAKQDAESIKADLTAQAHKEAEMIIAKAKEQLENERQALHKDLKEQVVTLSTILVRKALNEYLTEDAQRQVTQKIIANVPEKFS